MSVDKNSINCLYGGKILEENTTLENLIKSKSKDEKITILVYSINTQIEEPIEKVVKSSNIICPECKTNACIKINNIKYQLIAKIIIIKIIFF